MTPAAPRPIRVAILNDYEIVVAGISALLAPYAGRIEVVEEVGQLIPVSDVDIVLYDTFGQAQGNAIDIESIRARTQAKVIVFSWNTEPELIARAITKGASGYIAKSAEAGEVIDIVERVYAGETVVPIGVGETGGDDRGGWPGKVDGLTAREAEVIALITQGLSNQEIADRCYLSINSVKTYIRTAYRKIGVTRRSQAVLWGIDHGFQPDRFRRFTD